MPVSDFMEARRMQDVEAVAGARLDGNVRAASALFEEAVDWLREHYGQFEFWVERDLVWSNTRRLPRSSLPEM